jgi:hypothetical protein
MTGRKRIEKYEKFGLHLTQAERKLILVGIASLPRAIAQLIQTTPANKPTMMTLDHWKELAHVWGEFAFRAPSDARVSSVLRGFLSQARRCF